MIWYDDGSGGAWVEVAASEGGGGASITVQDDPPANPGNNALWWSSKTGQLALWYNDGNSRQWVVVRPFRPRPTCCPREPHLGGDAGPHRGRDLVRGRGAADREDRQARRWSRCPRRREGYPTLIFSKGGTWQTAEVYVNANINKSGSQALASDAGSPGTCIFLGNQANQNVPTVVDMTFSFVGQPQVIATQSAYSSAVGQSIGVRSRHRDIGLCAGPHRVPGRQRRSIGSRPAPALQ